MKRLIHKGFSHRTNWVSSSKTDCSTQIKKRHKTLLYMESQTSPSPVTKASCDVTICLSQPCSAEDGKPLERKLNQLSWTSSPEPAQLAYKYFAIPASSVPAERIFSAAGKKIRPECCSLNDKTYEGLMLIKCNHIELWVMCIGTAFDVLMLFAITLWLAWQTKLTVLHKRK